MNFRSVQRRDTPRTADRSSTRRSVAWRSAVAVMVVVTSAVTHSSSAKASTSLSECRFGEAQVFDVQWAISNGNLDISDVARPYRSSPSAEQMTAGELEGTSFGFYDNGDDIGLMQYAPSGAAIAPVHLTGTFRAFGEGFLFYLGDGGFGTVITTQQGLPYGASTSLAIAQEYPSLAEARSFSSCQAEVLAPGEVARATQTISFDPPSGAFFYGDDQIVMSAPTSSSGLDVTVTSSTPAVCAWDDLNVAVYFIAAGNCTLTASQPGDSTYAPATLSRSLTVERANLAVLASSPTVSEGDSVPVISAFYDGFKFSDSPESLSAPATCATTYTTESPAGSYTTSCSGAASDNYHFIYVDGSVSVNPAGTPPETTTTTPPTDTTTPPSSVPSNSTSPDPVSPSPSSGVPSPSAPSPRSPSSVPGPVNQRTPVSGPAGPVEDPTGSFPELFPGEASASQVGQLVGVSAATDGPNGVVLSGPFVLSAAGPFDVSAQDGEVVLVAGGSINVSVMGLYPNSTANIWLFSTPTLLGEITVDADGVGTGTLAVPAGIPAGAHTLQANGLDGNGINSTMNFGVTLLASDEELPRTGSGMSLVYAAFVLLASGAAALQVARKRSKRVTLD